MLSFLKNIQQKPRFKRTFCVSLKGRIDVSRVSTLKRCNGVETPFKNKVSFSRELSGIILENSNHPDIFGPHHDCAACGGIGCGHCS